MVRLPLSPVRRDLAAEAGRKLLAADKATLALFRHDPFEGSPPTFLRARLFRYRYTTWRERKETGAWWVREPRAWC